MKKFKIALCMLMFFFAISCKKDKEALQSEKLTTPASFENTSEVIIPDATMVTGLCGNQTKPSVIESSITVNKSGTIKNPLKFSVEIDLSHSAGGDLVVVLIAPSGKSLGLIKRIGSTADDDCGIDVNFVGGNKLNFSSNQSFPAMSSISGETIGTGIYHATQGSTTYPNLDMMGVGVNLTNESITGNWKLKVYDCGVGTTGSLLGWKIIFDEGVL